MQRKVKYLVAGLAATALLLGGCGQSSSSSHQSSKASSSTTNTTGVKGTKSGRQQSSVLWNTQKDEQLEKFINQWAPTMHQSYEKYDGHNDLETGTGEKYPKDLGQTTVNGSSDSIGWAPSGKGKYDYNVVALYNYKRSGGPTGGHITYAFAFHDGQPVALVDQSTNGTPDWTPTKNTDVSGNFAKIANGSSASSSSSSKSTNANSSTKDDNVSDQTVGVMVALLQWPDWFKEGIKSGDMYYGTDSDSDNSSEVNGYSCVTENGDPESYLYYKRDGDNVTIKYWTTSGDETVAEGHFDTRTVSLKRLENDYYNNSSKKAEVDGYVSDLKPISEANQ